MATALFVGTTLGFLCYVAAGGKNYQLGVLLGFVGACIGAVIGRMVRRS